MSLASPSLPHMRNSARISVIYVIDPPHNIDPIMQLVIGLLSKHFNFFFKFFETIPGGE